jgi:hypothetical protein
MTEYTVATRYTESDEEIDETINFKAIDYNHCLIEGIEAFERKDFGKSLEKYTQALQYVQEDEIERKALINSNIAMIHFYNHDYKKSLAQFEATLNEFRNFKSSTLTLSDYQQAIFIKLLGNICALNLFLNKFEESKDCSNEIISTIASAKPEKKKLLHEGLCFTFFRFKNFEILKDGYFQNLEEKYSGETLGSLYLILGMNRELLNDLQLAMIYYKKSFDVWHKLDDKLFMLLACRHITSLAQELNISNENAEFSNIIKSIMTRDEMKNISLDLLFKDFEKRLALARDITNALKKQEEGLANSANPRESLRKVETMKYEEPNLLGQPFWKQALKLKLHSALKSVESLKYDSKTKPQEKKQLDMGIMQVKKSLAMLQDEKNPLIQDQLMNLKYTKEAIDTVKAAVHRIRKVILANTFMEAFRKLLLHRTQKNRMSELIRGRNLPTSIYSQGSKTITTGDALVKINYRNGQKSTRYFKVFLDNSLRWSQKEKDLTNPKVYKSCHLSDVKGVIYGKASDRIIKNGKGLENWLCFSLVLPTRTIDLYCRPDQINLWYIGLAEEVKKINPNAFCLTVGQFLWRKLTLMGNFQITQYLGDKKTKKTGFRTFAKALVAFKRAAQQPNK